MVYHRYPGGSVLLPVYGALIKKGRPRPLDCQEVRWIHIQASGTLAITVLGKGNMNLVKHFGFQSGRNINKLAGQDYFTSKGGAPVLSHGSAYLDCKVVPGLAIDLGSHTLFITEVVDGGLLRDSQPVTYESYRSNRAKPDEMLLGDVQNVIATLNLEYGANRRYQHQIAEIKNPRINSVLEGVMRTLR